MDHLTLAAIAATIQHPAITVPAQPAQPVPAQPVPAQPDSGQPDSGQPDSGQPDAGRPDAGRPDQVDEHGQVDQHARQPGPAPGDRLAELVTWWDLAGPGDSPEQVTALWTGSRPFDPPGGLSSGQLVDWAVAVADAAIDAGTQLVLLSVPTGAGATPPAVLAASLLELDAADASGWPTGTGMSDIAWMVKATAIRDGLRRLRGPFGASGTGPQVPATIDPDQLLTRLNDRALTAGSAVLLRCASRRTPLLLDGVGSAACALLAQRVNPASAAWWQLVDGPVAGPAAGSAGTRGPDQLPGVRDPLHERLLTALRREPLLRLGLAWADGTAGQLGLTLLQAALTRRASS